MKAIIIIQSNSNGTFIRIDPDWDPEWDAVVVVAGEPLTSNGFPISLLVEDAEIDDLVAVFEEEGVTVAEAEVAIVLGRADDEEEAGDEDEDEDEDVITPPEPGMAKPIIC